MFAKIKLKFCFCFEKSIRIRTAFYKVDSKQTHRSKNIMQFKSFFLTMKNCENSLMNVEKKILIKMFGVHIREKN